MCCFLVFPKSATATCEMPRACRNRRHDWTPEAKVLPRQTSRPSGPPTSAPHVGVTGRLMATLSVLLRISHCSKYHPGHIPSHSLPNLFMGPSALRESGFRKAHPASLPPLHGSRAHLSTGPHPGSCFRGQGTKGASYQHGGVLSPVPNNRAVPL